MNLVLLLIISVSSLLNLIASDSDLRRSLDQLRSSRYHGYPLYRGYRSPRLGSPLLHRLNQLNQPDDISNPFHDADTNERDYDMFDLLDRPSDERRKYYEPVRGNPWKSRDIEGRLRPLKKRDWMDISPVKPVREDIDLSEAKIEELLLGQVQQETKRTMPWKPLKSHTGSVTNSILHRTSSDRIKSAELLKGQSSPSVGKQGIRNNRENQPRQRGRSGGARNNLKPSTFDVHSASSEHVFSDRKARNSTYQVDLDTTGNYRVYWTVDNPAEVIYFRLEANVDKKDVLGFGFSPYGESEGADFVVLWTGIDGRHLFQSIFDLISRMVIQTQGEGYSRGRLKIDRQQDYILDEVTVTKDGYLAVEFHRLLDTCDQDDYLIDSGTTHMLVFSVSGELDTIQNLDITSTHPILQRSQLIKSQLPDPVLPADTKTFVMHVNNVKVPEQETTYWCALRKLPELKEKHHLIQFEGAISKTGEGIVHHLEVFHCTVPDHVTLPEYDAQCVNSGRPKGLESCMKVLGAWAMGAKPVSYPEEAGSPVGGPGFSRYVMLEVHYNNPELKKGIVDSSGLKFYITPTLRRYDAGIMELGLEYTDKMALPPGQQAVKLVGYCVPECTQVAFPRDGIKVFASQLHTHLTGRAAYTKHYRQGVELPELNRDNHFSPHYQEIRKLPRQVHVLPGDSLVTTCIDRTVDRPNVTLGGFAITDEMCVNYIHYYPLVDLEVCKSAVTTESLYGFFNFLNLYQDERTSNRSGISHNYKSIRWTLMNTALLESYYEEAPLSMQCNRSDGTRHPGRSWEDISVPEIIQPMPERVRPCLQ